MSNTVNSLTTQVPKIMRDPESGNSKGFAFVNFASFEASDMALEAMNGQYLCNRAITCSYAFKKDAKGERHGTAAERLLAAQNPLFQQDRPNQMFAGMCPMLCSVKYSEGFNSVNVATKQELAICVRRVCQMILVD